MSDTVPLSLSYCIYQSSFVSNHCQYFLICDLFSPTNFFHSFPYSYLEGLWSFISSSQQYFYHSLLKISLSLRSSVLFLLSYCYPSFNFSVKFGISCNNIPQIAKFVHITILFRLSSVYFDSSLLSSAYLQYISLFDKQFHPMFFQTLFSVFIIVCSVDLWILAIVAWSSNHPSNLNALINLPPAFSRYHIACSTSYSTYMQIVNSSSDSGHPCLTPLPTLGLVLASEHSRPILKQQSIIFWKSNNHVCVLFVYYFNLCLQSNLASLQGCQKLPKDQYV